MDISGSGWLWLGLIGIGVGIISGMLGIGGGTLVIPALVTIYGFSHTKAVGTSLAMLLPPIGILAVLDHYRAGNVSISTAGVLAAGFAIGGYFGARLVTSRTIPEPT